MIGGHVARDGRRHRHLHVLGRANGSTHGAANMHAFAANVGFDVRLIRNRHDGVRHVNGAFDAAFNQQIFVAVQLADDVEWRGNSDHRTEAGTVIDPRQSTS